MARMKSTTLMTTSLGVLIASIKTLITLTEKDLSIEKIGPRNGAAIATLNTDRG